MNFYALPVSCFEHEKKVYYSSDAVEALGERKEKVCLWKTKRHEADNMQHRPFINMPCHNVFKEHIFHNGITYEDWHY